MSDLLIRNLPEPMRVEIHKAAASSGRSLSDEAKHLIRKGLAAPLGGPEPGVSAWDELREALCGAQLSDDDHAALLETTTALRRSGIRQTPEFE